MSKMTVSGPTNQTPLPTPAQTAKSGSMGGLLSKAVANFEKRGGTRGGRKRVRPTSKRQWTRQIIKTDRFEQIEWFGNQDEGHRWYTSETIIGVRNDPEMDAAINDLYIGDLKNPEDRPGYLNGPELLQDVFYAFLQPAPKMHKKSEVVKDARLNGKFLEQMMALPVFEEIRDYSITDPETAKGATLALVDVIQDLIRQHREAVEQANEDRRNNDGDNDPFAPPGDDGRESWDEETPGNQKNQKSQKSKGNNKDTGKSQNGEDEKAEDEETADDGEGQEDWDPRDEEGDDESDDTESGDGEGEGEGEGKEEPEGDIEDLLDDAERDFNEDLDNEYEEESNWEKMVEGIDFGRMANRALREFAEEQEELQTAVTGVGLTPEEWKLMDPKERLRIAKQLNTPRMKQIADMVGRMKRFALSKQQSKVNDSPHEIYTIEQGRDLVRTVRSEFALLGRPETKIWFFYKFLNGELLQYKKRGQETVGKGPMIVCIDNSGSMSGAPENWAKGVAEALRRIASDEGRDYYAIYFETNYHRERFDFPKGKGSFEKVMAFLSISAGGGTEFDGVLNEALQKAQEFDAANAEHGKTDIVFVTDGMANLDKKWIDDFNRKRQEAGVRVFSIYISAYDSSRGPAMQLLESFSDVAVPVKALEVDDQTTSQLFSMM